MRGRTIALSRPRRIVADLMHFSRDVPGIPIELRMRLADIAAARQAHPDRPPFSALFVKGFALLARETPQLRRVYLRAPRARLYEYPIAAASVVVERAIDGEAGLIFRLIKDPAVLPVAQIGRVIRHAAGAPIADLKQAQALLRLAQYPWPLRRLAWWVGLNSGRQRGNYFGTFGVTTLSGQGAELLHPRAPVTSLLTYGRLDAGGSLAVRLIFDHRVYDGMLAARALARLEEILNGPVREELRG
ncbi:MAG: hypothetical protein HY056_11890 [Proteobacteria bacterium]|nr:hypothetical protein [Pseudomonadota bacterium]